MDDPKHDVYYQMAYDMAKILAANPATKASMYTTNAEGIADFIETLANRLVFCQEEIPEIIKTNSRK